MATSIPTKCAPAERQSMPAVKAAYAAIAGHFCAEYFNLFPLPVLVLNNERQIVFGNQALLDTLGSDELDNFLGKRPGEALQCIFSIKEIGGCGTSENCRECGALLAIMGSMLHKKRQQFDCQLLQNVNGETSAMDLRVIASPWQPEDTPYCVLSIINIEDEKRRQILERLFFHDILNSAGGAQGIVELLYEESPPEFKDPLKIASRSLYNLVLEIEKQKEFLALERGEYTVCNITLDSQEILAAIAEEFKASPLSQDVHIEVDQSGSQSSVHTDYTLLRRALSNMFKNALEATEKGGLVRAGTTTKGNDILFWVHNDAVMPSSVKLQIFKRSFSTKGTGRGLGTYSIKLLTENYLRGGVGFTSDEQSGTTFWIRLPRNVD